MEIIFNKLTLKEFFEYGGIVSFYDTENNDTYNEKNVSELNEYKLMLNDKKYEISSYRMRDYFYSYDKVNDCLEYKKSPEAIIQNNDPYGIKNVNFSLITINDKENWGKYKKQRLQRGFDDSELWNLDNTIINFIIPRLKEFKNNIFSFPSKYENEIEWKNDIDKMIKSFEILAEETILNEENEKKVNEGLTLFTDNLMDLWQ